MAFDAPPNLKAEAVPKPKSFARHRAGYAMPDRPNDSTSEKLEKTEPGRTDAWGRAIHLAIAAGLILFVAVALRTNLFRPMRVAIDSAPSHVASVKHPRISWAWFIERVGAIWVALGALSLTVRTWCWFRYRPAPPAAMHEAPTLTVIIPAYNEGAMVAQAIDSVANASYPRDRLEIIVIDDGSQDDTFAHIERAVERHAGLVTPRRFASNRGKRAALEEGFRLAKGEVIVTIDSDSVIEPDALLEIAGPFRDARVGAVGGKVLVLNRREGLIPRMMHARFTLNFDFDRAAQSTIRTVHCCPGALTAYRSSVVRQVLDAWASQSFLGVQCTFGEDRAMTNFILETGHDALYQQSAIVHTVVPTSFTKLCRMLLRWDRSHVREELRFARSVVWKRPSYARAFGLYELVVTNLRYPIAYASLFLVATIAMATPSVLVRVFVAMLIFSLFNLLYCLKSERSSAMLFGVLYAYFALFALTWVFPYAVLTARSRSWMTRDLARGAKPSLESLSPPQKT